MESTSKNEQSIRGVKKNGGDNHSASNGSDGHHRKPSKSELLSSAKVVADAARRRGENKADKAEVAGAAANLLQAASEYGKLEDKTLGKYMEKAENHLRHYHNSHSTTTTNNNNNNNNTGISTNQPAGKDNGHYSSVNSGSGDPDHHQGGGKGKYEDYIKLAEGLAEGIMKKHSATGGSNSTTDTSSPGSANTQYSGNIGGEHGGHSGSGSGNGYGQYVKMAGEFLKKH